MSNRMQTIRMIPQLGVVSLVTLAWLLLGCGVEVGNPSEPTPTQPKDSYQPALPGTSTVPIDNIDTVEPVEPVKFNIRSLVENQYDEAITAAFDFAFENTGAALALATNESRTCGQQEDGSLVLNHQETNSGTRPSGQGQDGTLVTESFSRVFASRMQSPDMALVCNTSLTKPKLDWSALTNLITDGDLERTNSRLVVMSPSGEFVRESSVKSAGSHQSMVNKVNFNATEGLKLGRTLTFNTDMEINTRSATAAATILNTNISTVATAPLVVNESYNAELKLRSLKIVSGSVSSVKADDGLTVIMHYDDVVMDVSGTCRPVSGKITGEIQSASNPGQVQETFSIAFAKDENIILYADGTGSRLEFEPCRIETDDDDDDGDGKGKGQGDRN
ncbi:hypothetical protein [Oligoflexus tunisiensis]|uniref:hypothetical protein n=1 Tax=Oligoflexus tunisiensis TaxID=708132 RepID=UPI00114CC984|nr:hypothetical protein [Oligoflexus tunisiensis]